MISKMVSYFTDSPPLKNCITTSSNSNFLLIEDKRSWCTKITNFAVSILKECVNRLKRWSCPYKREDFPILEIEDQKPSYSVKSVKKESWATSKALVVLIHGLNSSPLAFHFYLKELEKYPVSCFIPNVYKKGYCKISEAANPILDVIQQFADSHSEKPIFLVGHSYGALTAAYIERKLKAKNIYSIFIEGPYNGSSLINTIYSFNLSCIFGLNEKMSKRLEYEGYSPIKRLKKWRESDKKYIKEKKPSKDFSLLP